MRVTVFRDRMARGWPDTEHAREDERGHTVTLAKAMTHRFSTDAHFTQYTSDISRRLNTSSPDAGVHAIIDVIVFDVDAPQHGPVDEWRNGERLKMACLGETHPNPSYYETRGGFRIIYKQPATVAITSREDAAQWRVDYLTTCNYLERVFGIVADRACADWTRFFRAPYATRDGIQPSSVVTYGDPESIGALSFVPSPGDVPQLAHAHRLPPAEVAQGGRGLLYELLSARGHVYARRKNGFEVRCPNCDNHSSGRDGDSSTLLYLPRGRGFGYVHCLHAHCIGRTSPEWLRFFSESEIREAKERLQR